METSDLDGPGAELLVWKRLRLGRFRSPHELESALTERGICIDTDLIQSPAFTMAAGVSYVQLVRASPRRLGFTGRRPVKDVFYARAFKLGLTYCPAEVGPLLRLRLEEEPAVADEYLHIAMRPIARVRDGIPSAFYIRPHMLRDVANSGCSVVELDEESVFAL